MNKTIRVGTLFDCNKFYNTNELVHNPSWRHNMVGCCIIQILQYMYELNVSYVVETMEIGKPIDLYRKDVVDLYALPVAMTPSLLEVAVPVQTVLKWRFGFILRQSHDIDLYYRYYSKPFTRPTWNCLYGIAIAVTLLFYFLTWWEKRLTGSNWEFNVVLEMLLVIGGYCQHIFPVEATLNSRRTAHFTFFLYAYIVYSFYTANLLSHLVNDSETYLALVDLAASNLNIAVLKSMESVLFNNYTCYSCRNLTLIAEKLKHVTVLNLNRVVEAVRSKETALLSDYISIYPVLQTAFSNDELCRLIEIDLYSEVRKYLFASKRFRFNEELRIGTLRAKEAGILGRITSNERYNQLSCGQVTHQEVEIQQIFTPYMVLLGTYTICVGILFVERWWHKRRKVWPYVE